MKKLLFMTLLLVAFGFALTAQEEPDFSEVVEAEAEAMSTPVMGEMVVAPEKPAAVIELFGEFTYDVYAGFEGDDESGRFEHRLDGNEIGVELKGYIGQHTTLEGSISTAVDDEFTGTQEIDFGDILLTQDISKIVGFDDALSLSYELGSFDYMPNVYADVAGYEDVAVTTAKVGYGYNDTKRVVSTAGGVTAGEPTTVEQIGAKFNFGKKFGDIDLNLATVIYPNTYWTPEQTNVTPSGTDFTVTVVEAEFLAELYGSAPVGDGLNFSVYFAKTNPLSWGDDDNEVGTAFGINTGLSNLNGLYVGAAFEARLEDKRNINFGADVDVVFVPANYSLGISTKYDFSPLFELPLAVGVAFGAVAFGDVDGYNDKIAGDYYVPTLSSIGSFSDKAMIAANVTYNLVSSLDVYGAFQALLASDDNMSAWDRVGGMEFGLTYMLDGLQYAIAYTHKSEFNVWDGGDAAANNGGISIKVTAEL